MTNKALLWLAATVYLFATLSNIDNDKTKVGCGKYECVRAWLGACVRPRAAVSSDRPA